MAKRSRSFIVLTVPVIAATFCRRRLRRYSLLLSPVIATKLRSPGGTPNA
jgi:hypothetical protein